MRDKPAWRHKPDVQQFGCLNEAGLVGLLQHFLCVSHEAAVLQHALILLHLTTEPVHTQVPGLLDGPQHLGLSLLKGLEETLKVFVGLSLCELPIFLRS